MASSNEGIRLSALAQRWNMPLPETSEQRLLAFFRLLLEWNQRINLTGAKSLDALVDDHLPDSMAMHPLVPAEAQVLDVGSGGGLPALPFAILRPDCQLSLVEPRTKRVAFLRTATRELGLKTTILEGRVEDLESDLAGRPQGFDAVSSRATFPPAEWLALGARLVRPGGRVLVFTTPDEQRTLPPPQAAIPYAIPPNRPRVLLAFDR